MRFAGSVTLDSFNNAGRACCVVGSCHDRHFLSFLSTPNLFSERSQYGLFYFDDDFQARQRPNAHAVICPLRAKRP
jgi:hypothetical protein